MTLNGKQYSTPKNINLKGGILRFDATQSINPLSATSNGIYVNSSNQLVYSSQGSTTILGVSGGGSVNSSWENIFAQDATFTITADSTFTIAGNRATATDVVTITNIAGGSGDCLQITNSGTGSDVKGTSATWSVSKAGAAVFNASITTAAIVGYAAGADCNMTIDAKGAGTITFGATSSGAFTFTRASTFSSTLTVTDGVTTLGSSSNAAAALIIQNDTITTFGNGTTEDQGMVIFSSDTLTTGDLLRLQLDESALNGGAFLKAVQTDAGAAVFTVAENGVTTIAGAGGANALVVTAGDLSVADGSLTIADADNAATLSITNNTATSESPFVFAGSGVYTGSTTKSFMTITPSGMTTGTGLYISGNALTTGNLVGLAHTTAVIANGGSMLRITSTSIDTSTTTGCLLDLSSTASVAGTQILASLVTTTGIGMSLVTAITSGTALSLTNGTGIIVTTGEMLLVTANSATTCTGLVRVSGTGLTDGFAMELTGGGANATASGGVLNLVAGAATAGSALKITTSGVYSGTTGVVDINASSATTGIIVDINASGLTEGSALKINATEATITTGFYINCYDGAASDFTVGKYGATVIAGNASTTVLTLTAGNAVITAGNLVLTAGTVIETAQAILNANTAISVTHGVTKIANNAGSTHSLADGVEGQRKTIICTAYVGDAVITPANLANGTTITLNAVGDACTLVFLGTEWWVESLYGTAALA